VLEQITAVGHADVAVRRLPFQTETPVVGIS
jgi:hypothetical protein